MLRLLDVKPCVWNTGRYISADANEGFKVVIYMCWQITTVEILVTIILITTFDDPVNNKQTNKKNADTQFDCKIVTPFPSLLT